MIFFSQVKVTSNDTIWPQVSLTSLDCEDTISHVSGFHLLHISNRCQMFPCNESFFDHASWLALGAWVPAWVYDNVQRQDIGTKPLQKQMCKLQLTWVIYIIMTPMTPEYKFSPSWWNLSSFNFLCSLNSATIKMIPTIGEHRASWSV